MSCKIAGACMLKIDSSMTEKCQDLINTNTMKFKAEKFKDNKLAIENELNMKRSKCQKRNIKANKQTIDAYNTQNKENIKTSEKSDAKENTKEKEIAFSSENSIKYNAKETKEKRNKEDTKNRNRGNNENDIGGNKETAMPFMRNKEQFSDQVHVLMYNLLFTI